MQWEFQLHFESNLMNRKPGQIVEWLLGCCFYIFTTRKRSLGQGIIFTSVCQEFCSRGVPGPGGCLVQRGEVFAQGGCGDVETSPTATAAGGTHPTGMHSCSE